MSAALSAAKKRRAPTASIPEPPARIGGGNGAQSGSSTDTQGLTLPQVISLIDKRLVQLELFAKNVQKNGVSSSAGGATNNAKLAAGPSKEEVVEAVLEEFNTRFDIMAEEIANIKNIVLNLQSYTMDVNKMLLQNMNVGGVADSNSSSSATFSFSNGDDDVAESSDI